MFENLGLGESLFIPVGVPIPYPLATPPAGFLKLNGAPFDKAKYPQLAAIYPGGVLPDLRGEFIRGWDDGRGVDSARMLLSSQAGMIEKHRHPVIENEEYDNSSEWDIGLIARPDYKLGRGIDRGVNGSFIASPTAHNKGRIGNAGGAETRPRNIAFNYIVRAA
ncbi:phage tail protein [Siccibacter turicensis]|nr:phage tail protein [Siccibacter turicensis]